MEKEIAKKIILELERLGDVMNDIAAIIEEISNEEENKKFRREIADLMIRSFTKIMHPFVSMPNLILR